MIPLLLGALASIGAALLSIRGAHLAGLPLADLALYFDGHLYLSIAQSFPLPFTADALHYAGQAPGYPALIALVHALGCSWGLAALVVPWMATGASVGIAAHAFGPWSALVFALAYPYGSVMAASAHPEPVAVLALTLALVTRERAWVSAACVAAAVLTRFPALVVLPACAWAWRDRRALLVPLVALAFWHAYLAWRIPGFTTVWSAHDMFWAPTPGVPFASFLRWPVPWFTWGALVLLGGAGLVAAYRRAWMPALWIAGVLGFHAALNGDPAAFARFVVLAWPAAFLVAPQSTRWRALALVAVLTLGSQAPWTVRRIAMTTTAQPLLQPFLPGYTGTHPPTFLPLAAFRPPGHLVAR